MFIWSIFYVFWVAWLLKSKLNYGFWHWKLFWGTNLMLLNFRYENCESDWRLVQIWMGFTQHPMLWILMHLKLNVLNMEKSPQVSMWINRHAKNKPTQQNMDSWHLNTMCNVHNHHFALCSHDKKEIMQLIPYMVWKVVGWRQTTWGPTWVVSWHVHNIYTCKRCCN